MTELYLDSDVSLRLAPLLQTAGHSVVAARDVGLTTATDDVQLLVGTRNARTLITHSRRDFMLRHGWPREGRRRRTAGFQPAPVDRSGLEARGPRD